MGLKKNQKIKWKNLVDKNVSFGMDLDPDKLIISGKLTKTRKVDEQQFVEIERLEPLKSLWIETKYIVYILSVKD